MDHLRQVILCLLLAFTTVADAAMCTEYFVRVNPNQPVAWHSSKQAACEAMRAFHAGLTPSAAWTILGVTTACGIRATFPTGSPADFWADIQERSVDCQAGICQSLTGNTTGQSSHYAQFGNATPQQMASWLGTAKGYCDPVGCAAGGVVESCGKAGNVVSCTIVAPKFTGNTCDPNAEATGDAGQDQPQKCSAGQCPGTVNGVSVCVACSSSGGGSSTSSTTTSTSTTTPNPPTTDKTDTDTKVTCDDSGTCTKTTTTVVTRPDGTQTTKTDTQTGPKDSVCKNEDNPICRASTFSGACTGGFSCSGDAAQCAAAKAVNESNCLHKRLQEGLTDEFIAGGRAIADGTAMVDPKTVEGGAKIVNLGTLENVVNPYPDTCPADINFSLMGTSFAIPLAENCWALKALGVLLHLSTLLYASLYVIRGV